MKKLLLFAASVLCAATLHAAPNIASTTASTFTAFGTVVTVSGVDFGVAPSTVVFINDQLDNLTPSTYWNDCFDLVATNTSTYLRHSKSTGSYHINMTDGGLDEGKCQGATSPVNSTWTVSVWLYIHDDWDWGTSTFSGGNRFLSNIKIFRMWNPGSPDENFVMAYAGFNGTNGNFSYNTENTPDSATVTGFYSNLRNKWAPGSGWRHLEFEYSENTSTGAADGRFYVAIGTETSQRTNIVTRDTYTELKRLMLVGWSNVWGPDAAGDHAPNNAAMTDIYVKAGAWNKVAIGNASTWAACTRREWMTDTLWTNTQISFKNQLPADFGSTQYLYVIGAGGWGGGDISNGFDLTTAAAEGGGSPGSPSGLTIGGFFSSSSDNEDE